MRLVREADDLLEAVSAARNEAASAFGDPTVFLERYLERGRHVEVQVFGDTHGNVVHVFERECSIQRRHQKVVEESPSPGATAATLERMYAAAVAAAQAIDYVGAGTVEFMVAGEGEAQEFFFLEMNTRLQVEHPVTEEVTGLDLVEWQIRVAAGEPLPLAQEQITRSGHAIEVRLYAEDPARGYLPGMGRIECFEADPAPGIRVESGVETGSEVSAVLRPDAGQDHRPRTHPGGRGGHAGDQPRGAAGGRGADQPRVAGGDPALAGASCPGTRRRPSSTSTPRRPPRSSSAGSWRCTWPQPRSAWPSRSVWASRGPRWRRPAGATSRPCPRCAASGTPSSASTCRSRCTTPAIATVVWTSSLSATGSTPGRRRSRWGPRPCARPPRRHSSTRGPDVVDATFEAGLPPLPARLRVDRTQAEGNLVMVEVDGVGGWFTVRRAGDWVLVTGLGRTTVLRVLPRYPDASDHGHDHGLVTPVPGTVTAVLVEPGDHVAAGDTLVILEAMKMEHRIKADEDGVVAEVRVEVGDSVDAHHVVAVLEEE